MTRKGKQPGGHNPLTYNEKRKLNYGTLSVRLETGSKKRFGDCCLSLVPAIDPVATPSGHIYSREAILTYLLRKRKNLKYQRNLDEQNRLKYENERNKENNNKRIKLLEEFERKNNSAARISIEDHRLPLETITYKLFDTENISSKQTNIKRTSYWLSECQPQIANNKKLNNISNYPSHITRSDGVSSPMTGFQLRVKDLVPCCLIREEFSSKSDAVTNVGNCVCALSRKTITTQPVILIKKSGMVLLKDVYQTLVSNNKRKGILECPVTGTRFRYPKDILDLQRGTSGFSSSGTVLVKKYQPTLT